MGRGQRRSSLGMGLALAVLVAGVGYAGMPDPLAFRALRGKDFVCKDGEVLVKFKKGVAARAARDAVLVKGAVVAKEYRSLSARRGAARPMRRSAPTAGLRPS